MPKTLKDLLLLGNPKLYEVCAPIAEEELPMVKEWVSDLHDVMQEFRSTYHFGRAIAAPQLGIMKRLIYMHIESPMVFINPVFTQLSPDMFELWDDCMSFPNLLVKLNRHHSVTVKYLDENWISREQTMNEDLAELIQHEYDHLNGILCTMRAIDEKAFKWRSFE
jgi:peptide deformylase